MTEPTYCTREDVKAALDVAETARSNVQIDRARASATDSVDALAYRGRRGFSPTDATRYFAWPEQDGGGSWRLWLDQNGLISLTTLVAGGVTISSANVYLEPINDGPPYNRIELVRSTSTSFGGGPTPQRQIAITGTWGYRDDRQTAGTLSGAVNSSTTAVALSDGSQAGVGDLLVCDSERMVVSERSWVTTGSTLGGSLTASAAGTTLTGPTVVVGEQLQVDSETMLVVAVSGSTITVRRAWDGSTLAAHNSGTTVYANRGYVVARGCMGTSAASHTDATTVQVHRPPALVRELALAEAISELLQSQAGRARTVRASQDAAKDMALGHGMQDLRDRVSALYARNTKTGAA